MLIFLSNLENYGQEKTTLVLKFSNRITIIEYVNMLKVNYIYS